MGEPPGETQSGQVPSATDLRGLEQQLAAAEASFLDIMPGAAKQILWADPAKPHQTAIAIVYVHGFSATAGEVRPLPDLVAADIGANLFYTRLAGHGRGGSAMTEGSVDGWLTDMREALRIAGQIGSRVVVIATSTGATLATLSLSDPTLRRDVAAAVFLSPNYAIKARGAFLLTVPGLRHLLPLLLGPERGFAPQNELHRARWVTRYPFAALLPMAELVARVRRVRVEAIDTPVLFLRSADDTVVDAAETDRVAARWGGPKTVVDPGPVGDPDAHVLAGEALSPETTGPLALEIVAWLRATLAIR